MEVEFLGEKTIDIKPRQSILNASLSAGIPHFHACGGRAKCSTCRVLVLEGDQYLNKPNARETKLKSITGLPDAVRLACQTKTIGNVKVERMLKDESDFSDVIHIVSRDPLKFRLKPMGQEKHLALFFLDIRNFTLFVETHPPFDVIYTMRKIFTSFNAIIVDNGGQLIETAGDEIYAVFGMTPSKNSSADNAINAGQKILDALEHINKTYCSILQKEIKVGIGIHSGNVILGEINLNNKSKIATVGLAINIASRIQKMTKKLDNSLLVSLDAIKESTLSPNVQATEINLEGVSAPILVYPLGKSYKT
ncbi:MAG TPA: adenylate/guanylate cyclase domain-containing protein [Chryseolinea sp.]|nr:adenylate/guanylate cyclase domain-containing protein [Chryseolinea sp.]